LLAASIDIPGNVAIIKCDHDQSPYNPFKTAGSFLPGLSAGSLLFIIMLILKVGKSNG